MEQISNFINEEFNHSNLPIIPSIIPSQQVILQTDEESISSSIPSTVIFTTPAWVIELAQIQITQETFLPITPPNTPQ